MAHSLQGSNCNQEDPLLLGWWRASPGGEHGSRTWPPQRKEEKGARIWRGLGLPLSLESVSSRSEEFAPSLPVNLHHPSIAPGWAKTFPVPACERHVASRIQPSATAQCDSESQRFGASCRKGANGYAVTWKRISFVHFNSNSSEEPRPDRARVTGRPRKSQLVLSHLFLAQFFPDLKADFLEEIEVLLVYTCGVQIKSQCGKYLYKMILMS